MRLRASLVLTAISAFLLAAGPAAAITLGDLSDLYVFGDSIVDAGNTQNALGGPGGIPCALNGNTPPCDATPASFQYFDGRFTNGPNAADILNQAIEGTNSLASTEGGQNYAFGGARATGGALPDLSLQVGQFLFDAGGVADPNALYLINIGGNDVRDQVQAVNAGGATLTDQQVISSAVGAITAQITALQVAGAQHFLVNGVGDVGSIPETQLLGAAAQAHGTALSSDMTAQIFAALAPEIFTVDVIDLFDQVLLDPAAFGLLASIMTSGSCLTDGFPAFCDPWAFFDPVHPTTQLHGILGEEMIAAVPEPGTASLLALGLLGLALRRRR